MSGKNQSILLTKITGRWFLEPGHDTTYLVFAVLFNAFATRNGCAGRR